MAPPAGAPKLSEAMTKMLDDLNINLSSYLMFICGGSLLLIFFWTIYHSASAQVRTVVGLSDGANRYFAQPPPMMSWFKKHIAYAPLFSVRHNREFQLSTAVNMGTLPSRFEFFILLGYFAANIAFCLLDVPFSETYSITMRSIRNRSGALATANMIPLFLFAGRNNPLIKVVGISFDSMNLMHRWLGRIVVIESLLHTFTHWAANSTTSSWGEAIAASVNPKSPFIVYGFVATIASVVIFIQASSVLRHAFYETFKVLHILGAVTMVIGLWWHLDTNKLPSLKYLVAATVLWGADRTFRVLRVLYYNIGNGGTQTVVEALPGNAVRITVTLARPWTFKPGQHAYMYFPTLSFLQSHPFSVGWAEDVTNPHSNAIAMHTNEKGSSHKTAVSFIVRARTGVTETLYRKAAAGADGRFTTMSFVEGPYGHAHSLDSYGTAMLFAAGVGITHQVPYVRQLLEGYAKGTVATRKIVLVWVIQSPEHLEWIRPWMTEILGMEHRRELLRVMLFISRPRSTKEIHSPSSTVQMFPGRPNCEMLIGMEMEQQLGMMAVTVCGPGSFSDEVRKAVRAKQMSGNVDFMEEAFSW